MKALTKKRSLPYTASAGCRVILLVLLLLVLFPAGHARCQAAALPAPRFSHERGFYRAPFELALTCDDRGAAIRYTTDGSEPDGEHGHGYGGGIHISRTTCIRAAAFRDGYEPSPVVTHSYLLGASEAVQSLPVLSLAGDERETFYLPNGICAIRGGVYTGNYVSWRPVSDSDYNFPLEHGRAFERPVSAELIFADGRPGFQADGGIRVNGSTYTRSRYRTGSKFSFRLYFRGDYGPKRLNYPLIVAPVAGFDRIVLRAGQSDAVNPFVKDELGRRLQREMSQIACLGTFVNLFINGRYQGYYNPVERIDEKMFQARFDRDEPWDVVTQWRPEDSDYDWRPGDPVDRRYRFDVRDGDPCSMNELLDYALVHDLRTPEHYREVAERLDITQFIDYLILEGYLSHRDWPHNNWTAARERSDGDLGRWRFYAWDLEHSFYSSDVNGSFKTPASGGDVQPVGILYEQLIGNTRFRRCFADRVQRHLFNGGALQAQHVTRRFEELRGVMAGVLPDMNTSIRDVWAPQRPAAVLASLENKGLFAFEGPRLFVDGVPYTGQTVRTGGVLTLENPHGSGVLLYTLDGTDPRLSTADTPEPDLEPPLPDLSETERGHITYEYWLDVPGSRVADLTDQPSFPANPTGSDSLLAFASPVRWADEFGARIYGYLYPPQTGDYTFWIASDNDGQLYLSTDDNPANRRTIASVTGWTSPQEWSKFASQRSDSIRLEEGRRYYIEALYKEQAGGDHVAVAWQGPGLPRQIIAGAHLGPADVDWSIPPPDAGAGAEAISPAALVYYKQEIVLGARTAVKARVLDGDLWSGLTEKVFGTGPFLLVNEVMADNVTTLANPDATRDFADWIELFNPTDVPVELAGLYITDDLHVPLQWRIPDGVTLAPGGFLVLFADGHPERGPAHLPFKLDRAGEAVGIYDPQTHQWVDWMLLPALGADQALARYPDGAESWAVSEHASPGFPNAD